MKRLLLVLAFVGGVYGQSQPNAVYSYRFTTRAGEQTDGVNVYSGASATVPIDNSRQGCIGFQLTYSSEGLSAVSINLQTAPKQAVAGQPGNYTYGAFSTYGGTASVGSLPMTSTAQGNYVGYGYYPYIRVNLATATGTGSIDATLSCWKSITYAGVIGGGGGGAPTGAAGGGLSGTYPDPDIAAGLDAAKIADGSVSNAEFQRLDATSSIQTQLDAKAAVGGDNTYTGANDFSAGTVALPTDWMNATTTETISEVHTYDPKVDLATLKMLCDTLPTTAAQAGGIFCNAAGVGGYNDGFKHQAWVTVNGTGAAYGTAPTATWIPYWNGTNYSLGGEAGFTYDPATDTFTAPNTVLSTSVLLPKSDTLPATCTIGQGFMDTNATSGSRWNLCEATNTWVTQGGGGGPTVYQLAPYQCSNAGSSPAWHWGATSVSGDFAGACPGGNPNGGVKWSINTTSANYITKELVFLPGTHTYDLKLLTFNESSASGNQGWVFESGCASDAGGVAYTLPSLNSNGTQSGALTGTDQILALTWTTFDVTGCTANDRLVLKLYRDNGIGSNAADPAFIMNVLMTVN